MSQPGPLEAIHSPNELPAFAMLGCAGAALRGVSLYTGREEFPEKAKR
jgi:hypothetical protein